MGYQNAYATILLAGPETDRRAVVTDRLVRWGYSCVTADTGVEAKNHCRSYSFDLLLLELYMPDGHAADFLKELRTRSDIPALVICDNADPSDELFCLEAGADDFYTFQHDNAVLFARIRSLLRRALAVDRRKNKRNLGDVEMNDSLQSAICRGKSLKLTPTEFKILRTLGQSVGQPVSREEILMSVWQTEFMIDNRLVDSHVRNLRKKLSEGCSGLVVASVRGVGYRLATTPYFGGRKDS
jgi:DNA-binding response OmpR family regulator